MFRNWDSDPEVAKYTFWIAHKNVEETKKLVNVWLEEEKRNRYSLRYYRKGQWWTYGSIDVVKFNELVACSLFKFK